MTENLTQLQKQVKARKAADKTTFELAEKSSGRIAGEAKNTIADLQKKVVS